jgi:hypothetical protein
MNIIRMSVLFLTMINIVFAEETISLKDRYINLIKKSLQEDAYHDPENSGYLDNIRKLQETGCVNKTIAALREGYLDLVKKSVLGTLYYNPNNPNNRNIIRSLRKTCCSEDAVNALKYCMQEVEKNRISGDFLEAGVWAGGMTIFMKAFIEAYSNKTRNLWVLDSFKGWPVVNDDPDAKQCNNQNIPWVMVSLETVKSNFSKYDLLDNRINFIEGFFSETLPSISVGQLAILRLDSDLYASTMESLNALYPKLAVGGYVIIDDYGCFNSCDRAVNEYREQHNINDKMVKQGSVGVYWQKTHE